MDVSLTPQRHVFTVEQFDRMGEAGVFGPEDRVELIEGEIIEMSPIGDPHAGGVDLLAHLFFGRVGGRAIVRVQSHVRTSDISKPQPDLALLRPRADWYKTGAPRPEDMFLVIEVSDTTLRYDRDTKALLYGKSGVPETWVLDVNEPALIVFREPGPDGYGRRLVLRRGDRIALVAFPDVELEVDDILGPQAGTVVT